MRILSMLLLALSLVLLGGCASTAQRQTARIAIRYDVSSEVLRKIDRGDRLALADLELLAQAQVPDADVLIYLKQTNVSYKLTTAQIDRLRAQGVSDFIIDYLLATSTRVARPYRGYVRSRTWYQGYGHGTFAHGYYGHGFGHGALPHGGHH